VRAATIPKPSFLGLGAYRHAFSQRNAGIGEQAERFTGARVGVLPNPSGLNAHYQLAELVHLYRRLRDAVYL
jgi:TDG/mug DNA glycosylase family protein